MYFKHSNQFLSKYSEASSSEQRFFFIREFVSDYNQLAEKIKKLENELIPYKSYKKRTFDESLVIVKLLQNEMTIEEIRHWNRLARNNHLEDARLKASLFAYEMILTYKLKF